MMKIAVVGAGAMGGSFGGHLAKAGHEVRLVDIWPEHIESVTQNGLKVTGALGDYVAKVPITAKPDYSSWADWVIAFIDTNATREAAATINQVMAPNGSVITMQNGIGNVETLAEELGAERVVGGSSMCSAAVNGPGDVALTHHDTSSIGEVDGKETDRINEFADTLRSAGFDIAVKPDIMSDIWKKFLLNCGINALCAVSGLRTGEMTRIPELATLQNRILDEALAVTDAKGIQLEGNVRDTVKRAAHYRFNKPSMLQHVTVGRRTEIDAINGALVREAGTLGIPTPYNEALVALLKGRETSQMRAVHEPDLDYNAWEQKIADEPLPD